MNNLRLLSSTNKKRKT